jgi:amino acid transporter
VASQFTEPGGAYLYTRTAFGRFVGMQIGWFFLLAVVGGVAVAANLFVDYLPPFLPWTLNAWERGLVMGFVIAIPTAANYCGVRSGANLSTAMTLAKVSPLVLLILFGVARFAHQPLMIQTSLFPSVALISLPLLASPRFP